MSTIDELLDRAKAAIESGETSLRAAAEHIAAAEAEGASQRAIAKKVGKSVGYVNGLLAWHRRGYEDVTPFGPQSKASRVRRESVQSPEQQEEKVAIADENSGGAKRRSGPKKSQRSFGCCSTILTSCEYRSSNIRLALVLGGAGGLQSGQPIVCESAPEIATYASVLATRGRTPDLLLYATFSTPTTSPRRICERSPL